MSKSKELTESKKSSENDLVNSSLYVNLKNLANAKMDFISKYYGSPDITNQKKLDDFNLYQMIGKGAFATVYMATDKESSDGKKSSKDADVEENKNNKQFYAIKVQNKERIIREQQVEHIKSEKRILASVKSNFIISLLHSFQDFQNIYLALEFMPGGELFRFLRTRMYFGEETAKFYSMQIIMAMEYLHMIDVVYRDLKPENILLGPNGYLKLADFGFAKLLLDNRTYTLCGTPEYLAPEIILHRGYGTAVDWWAIGIFIFELLVGHTPFCSTQPKHIYEKILGTKVKFPAHIGLEAKSLVKKLLEPDVSRRLGNLKLRAEDVKSHRWFVYSNKASWESVYEQKLELPREVATHRIRKPEVNTEYQTQLSQLEDQNECDASKAIFLDF